MNGDARGDVPMPHAQPAWLPRQRPGAPRCPLSLKGRGCRAQARRERGLRQARKPSVTTRGKAQETKPAEAPLPDSRLRRSATLSRSGRGETARVAVMAASAASAASSTRRPGAPRCPPLPERERVPSAGEAGEGLAASTSPERRQDLSLRSPSPGFAPAALSHPLPFRERGNRPCRCDGCKRSQRGFIDKETGRAAMSPLPERERVPSEGEAGEGLAASTQSFRDNAGQSARDQASRSPSPGFAPAALCHPLPFRERGNRPCRCDSCRRSQRGFFDKETGRAAMSPLPERERVPSAGEAGEGLAASTQAFRDNAGQSARDQASRSPSPGFAPAALSHPLPFRERGNRPCRCDGCRRSQRGFFDKEPMRAAMSPLPERERVPSAGEAGEGLAARTSSERHQDLSLRSPSPGFAPAALSHPLPFRERGNRPCRCDGCKRSQRGFFDKETGRAAMSPSP